MAMPRLALSCLNPWRLWSNRRAQKRQRDLDDRLLCACMAYGHDARHDAQRALSEGANPNAMLGGREAALQALIHGQADVAELILSNTPSRCGEFAQALLTSSDAPVFAIPLAISALGRSAPIGSWASPDMLWLALARGADEAAMILLEALPHARASHVCHERSSIPLAALAMAMGNPCSAKILIARESKLLGGTDWLSTHAMPLCLCALSSSRLLHPRSIAALPDSMRWLHSPQAILRPQDFELMQAWTRGLPDRDFGGSMGAFDADPALEAAFFECSAQSSDGAQAAFIRLGAPPSIIGSGAIQCEHRIFHSTCAAAEESSLPQNNTKRL